MRNRVGAIAGGVLAVLALLAFYNLLSSPVTSRRPRLLTDYSRFIADVDAGKVEQVTFRGSATITGKLKDGPVFESAVPHVQVIPGLTDHLLSRGVEVAARPGPDEDVPSLLNALINWLPLILFYVFLYLAFARPMLAVARRIEGFAKIMQEQSSRPPSTGS